MRKKVILSAFVLGSILMACGKAPETVPETTFNNLDNSYRMTVNIREHSQMISGKSADFIYLAGTDAMPYDIWYGTEGANAYYKANSEIPVLFINGAVYETIYENFWTHDAFAVPFEHYTEDFNAFFTASNLSTAQYTGDAEVNLETNPEVSENAAPTVCQIYRADTSSLISMWNFETVSDNGIDVEIADDTVSEDVAEVPMDTSYTAMTTDLYVSGDKIVYAVMEFSGVEGYNTTITVKFGENIPDTFVMADEGSFMTFKEYNDRLLGYSVNSEGETAFDILEVTDEDIENESADGFYYADGTFVFSHPQNTQSWKHIVNGEVTEEFDLEANKYTNHETGEVVEGVVEYITAVDEEGNEYVYTKEDNLYGDYTGGTSVADMEDVYNQYICDIVMYGSTGKKAETRTSWATLLSYGDVFAAEHPDAVPEDIQNFTEKFYNDWTLQELLDYVKGNKASEAEKYAISYVMFMRNNTISFSDYTSITTIDLLKNAGLDVEAYYTSYVNGNGPWLSKDLYMLTLD